MTLWRIAACCSCLVEREGEEGRRTVRMMARPERRREARLAQGREEAIRAVQEGEGGHPDGEVWCFLASAYCRNQLKKRFVK